MDLVTFSSDIVASGLLLPLISTAEYLAVLVPQKAKSTVATMKQEKLTVGFEATCVPDLNALLDDGTVIATDPSAFI